MDQLLQFQANFDSDAPVLAARAEAKLKSKISLT